MSPQFSKVSTQVSYKQHIYISLFGQERAIQPGTYKEVVNLSVFWDKNIATVIQEYQVAHKVFF